MGVPVWVEFEPDSRCGMWIVAADEEHVPADMGRPRPGGRMSVPTPVKCVRCLMVGGPCDGKPGTRCASCIKAKRGCSYSNKKEKNVVEAPAPNAPASVEARGLTADSALATVPSTAAHDADAEESAMEVEIIGEQSAEDKVLCGSTMIPIRAINHVAPRELAYHAPTCARSGG
ncbi:hypothetical protein F4604DRAFT_1938632 [Suillus subluteus]|nr:hypothetical protein F4604DRAFT_1938632 [Suillus subluteus]